MLHTGAAGPGTGRDEQWLPGRMRPLCNKSRQAMSQARPSAIASSQWRPSQTEPEPRAGRAEGGAGRDPSQDRDARAAGQRAGSSWEGTRGGSEARANLGHLHLINLQQAVGALVLWSTLLPGLWHTVW